MLALYTDKEGTPEEKLGIYFDMYDIDRNGALDMKEIKRMITAIKSQVVWTLPSINICFFRSSFANLRRTKMEMFQRMSLSRCSPRTPTLSNTSQMLSFGKVNKKIFPQT